MAEPNSPQPPFPPAAAPLTGQLLHLPTARPNRPLPDPVAIRPAAIRPVAIPHPDPPYDPADDVVATGPLELISPISEASPSSASSASEAAHFDGQYSAGPWPSQFAQALAETLAGTRPQSQLAPWTTIQARRRIRRLSPVLASAGQPAAGQPTASQPRLRRVIITSPADGVLEMTVVIGLGQRVRALAVRLERSDAIIPADPAPPNSRPADQPRPAPAKPPRDAFPSDPRWRCTAIEAA
jgi:Family of unknown function (DUF6459)